MHIYSTDSFYHSKSALVQLQGVADTVRSYFSPFRQQTSILRRSITLASPNRQAWPSIRCKIRNVQRSTIKRWVSRAKIDTALCL